MKLRRRVRIYEAKARNVVNVEDIDKFISDISDSVPEGTPRNPVNTQNIKTWLQRNFRKWLINSYDSVTRITVARRGLPSWLINQAGGPENIQDYLDNNEVYEVNIQDDFRLEIGHVVDYLVEHTKPKEVLSRYDVPSVLEKARNWGASDGSTENTEFNSQDDPYDDSKAVKELMKFKDGSRWVEILRATDKDLPKLAAAIPMGSSGGNFTCSSTNPVLRKETFFMGHCIGGGHGYQQSLDSGKSRFISLRDKKNIPHATLEIQQDKVVTQLQGKANKAPDHKYTPAIIALLNQFKLYVNDDSYVERARIMKIGDKNNFVYYDRFGIAKLPIEELRKLNFTTSQLRKLGLVRINDTLAPLEEAKTKFTREELANSDLTDDELESIGLIKTTSGKLLSWPEMKGQSIAGNRSFEGLLADPELPDGITFEGSVSVSNWGWNNGTKTFPKGMHVKGNLFIRDSERLAKLPLDLKVDGEFTVKNCGLKVFPKGKFSKVTLEDVQIEELSNNTFDELILAEKSVKRIGSGVSIGTLRASRSNLSDIDASVELLGEVDLSGVPLKEFKPKKVGFSLGLQYSECEKIPAGLEVGGSVNMSGSRRGSGHVNMANTKITKIPKGFRSINSDEGEIVLFSNLIKDWPEDFVAHEVWVGNKVMDKPLPKSFKVDYVVNTEHIGDDGGLWRYSREDGELEPGSVPTIKKEE